MTRIASLRTIVADHDAALVDGYWVDPTTANMLCMVYDALDREANRDKFERVPLLRLVDFGWSVVKPKEG